MSPEQLFAMLSVQQDRVLDPKPGPALFWLLTNGFIKIAPRICGFELTSKGQKVMKAALQFANG